MFDSDKKDIYYKVSALFNPFKLTCLITKNDTTTTPWGRTPSDHRRHKKDQAQKSNIEKDS